MKTEELALLKETAQALNRAIACAELIAAEFYQRNNRKWVSLADAAKELGPALNYDFLQRQILKGVFTHGLHYINRSDGPKPSYAVNVPALREYFETPPEKRMASKS